MKLFVRNILILLAVLLLLCGVIFFIVKYFEKKQEHFQVNSILSDNTKFKKNNEGVELFKNIPKEKVLEKGISEEEYQKIYEVFTNGKSPSEIIELFKGNIKAGQVLSELMLNAQKNK